MAAITGAMVDGVNVVYPKLTAKANESKHLVTAMLSFLRRTNDGSARALHRIRAYECIADVDHIFDSTPGCFLDDASAHRVLNSYEQFLVHYNWLCRESLELGHPRYNITFKVHALYHMCFFSRFLHPRCTSGYKYEDYVGHVK